MADARFDRSAAAPAAHAILAAVLSTAAPAAAITNVVTPLGSLGGMGSIASSVNDAGEVAGSANTGSATHAFRYSGGVMTDLGTLGGLFSYGYGINDAGDVVGRANLPGNQRHAVLWSAGGGVTDLGTLGGTESMAYAINGAGQIVGWADLAGDTNLHAFRYSGGVMSDLGTFGFGGNSVANDINAAGDVVGAAYDGVSGKAFLWTAGVMMNLGTLVGDPASQANAINATGDVAGGSGASIQGTSIAGHAVSFAAGTVADLGAPDRSYALDINDAGEIVGETIGFDGASFRGFLHHAGVATDLNRLLPSGSGWVLRSAQGINNVGQIVGWGNMNDDLTTAFLLTLGTGCGNGLLDPGESCDDGNAAAGDGCSASCAIEASWQCEGQPSLCRISDRPIDGAKLVLKRAYRRGKLVDKLVFVSRDPNALFPAAGGPDDPSVVGAGIDLFPDRKEWSATWDLPAGNWETRGTGSFYRFVNSMAPNAVSGIRMAKLVQGRTIKIVAKGIPLDVFNMQGASIRVRTGSAWNCARFGPATVFRDSYRQFVAHGALAASISDCSEASLH